MFLIAETLGSVDLEVLVLGGETLSSLTFELSWSFQDSCAKIPVGKGRIINEIIGVVGWETGMNMVSTQVIYWSVY